MWRARCATKSDDEKTSKPITGRSDRDDHAGIDGMFRRRADARVPRRPEAMLQAAESAQAAGQAETPADQKEEPATRRTEMSGASCA